MVLARFKRWPQFITILRCFLNSKLNQRVCVAPRAARAYFPSMSATANPRPAKPGEIAESERTHAEPGPPTLAGVLGQREEFYRSVLDSLAEGVLITNAESRILYANRTLEEMTGRTKDELVGALSYELLAPREKWPLMKRRLRERLSGKSENYQNQLLRKDGSAVWIEVKATPYRDAKNRIAGTVGTLSCIDRQKTLERENALLRDELGRDRESARLIGHGPAFHKLVEQLKVVAPTCATVLLLGESGTGKELAASAIHAQSDRRDKPFVRVNCASIPKDLFESEFFGHIRGAFTGAVKDRVGRFELADGGTLFLDEVGEIPLELQSKLLRVLQEGQYERVGEERTRKVNVRLIAATNRDLGAEAKAGRFRQDLYYRLSVFPIELPALRDRREDIEELAEYFLNLSAQRGGMTGLRLSREQVRQLEAYDWPGNIRELQNVIERAVILARDGELQLVLGPATSLPQARNPDAALPTEPSPSPASLRDLKQSERALIENALKQTRGKIYGANGAAALLGVKPTTLASKISRMGLTKA